MDELIFESIEKETPFTNLTVSGTIPPWLKGSLVRNGPASYALGNYKLEHWFDGFSLLHKFNIESGRVSYQSKFLQSTDYKKNIKEGKITSRHFGTVPDPCASIFNKFFSSFKRPNPNNANVSVLKHGNKIVAVSDFSTMVEFDFNDLETKGEVQYNDQFGNGYMFSASHASYDPETNEFFNCVREVGPGGKIHFFKLTDESLQRHFLGSFKSPKHTFFHSIALTKKYVIFIEQPFELNLLRLMFGRVLNVPYEDTYKWNPGKDVKFHLLDRNTGKIRTASSDTFFFFHTVNAYDEGDNVIIDLCLYESPMIIKHLYIDAIKKNGIVPEDVPVLSRITINADSDRASIKKISNEKFDLPTFNTCKSCKEYQYVYGLGYKNHNKTDIYNQLVKVDAKTGSSITWYAEGKYPSEPLFAQSPGATDEDDGVILSVVLDTAKRNSFLLMLDARTYKEVARAEVPVHLPIGLHGMYYPVA
jgi:carotenoid cleavage dioxygenase-like enzyme